MISKDDIAKLAALARLEMSDAELSKMEHEIPAILSFVETISEVALDAPQLEPTLNNVMRNDEHPHESGIYTEILLDAAPAKRDNKVVVKQVISRKKT